MRITQNAIYNQMNWQLSNNSSKLLKAQETVATQKRFNSLSENPIDGSRVLNLQSSLVRTNQYVTNITRSLSVADVQDQTLDQLGTLITNVKDVLLGEANEVTSTEATRQAARIEIVNLTSQMVQLGNTQFDGSYLFSGYQSDAPAFLDAQVSTTPAVVAGRAAVTSQKVSDVTKLDYHDYQINFTAAGTYDIVDSTAGTTVASNVAYTSGDAIQLGGMAVVLTDSPAAPAAGDSYTVTASRPGVYQGDGGVREVDVQSGTRVPINIPGDRLFQGTGTTGGIDLFDTMNQINDALASNDQTQLNALLDTLDQARQQVSNERSGVGARVNLLESVQTRQEDISLNLQTLRSDLEDVDITESITALQKQQDTYDATLGAAAKIIQMSLLDFLN